MAEISFNHPLIDHSKYSPIAVPQSRRDEHAALWTSMKIGDAQTEAIGLGIAGRYFQKLCAVRQIDRTMFAAKVAIASSGCEARRFQLRFEPQRYLATMAAAGEGRHHVSPSSKSINTLARA